MNSSPLETAIEAWKRLWQGKGNQTQQTTRNKKKQKTKILRRTKKETMKQYQQRNLRGKNLDLQDVEEFGD